MTLQPIAMPPTRSEITGVVLAGGQGSRMGGSDKGLQPLGGQPLAWRTLQRLRPQVGRVAISANRNLSTYQRWCPDVWADLPAAGAAPDGFAGPLAGMLSALTRSSTPWVQLAACDTPLFPPDLVARLCAALRGMPHERTLAAAVPATTDADCRLWHHPTFALLDRRLLPSLQAFLDSGERRVMAWLRQQPHTIVQLEGQHEAFRNFNTLDDLRHG